MAKPRYQEGDLYLMPVPKHASVLVLIARKAKRGREGWKGLLVYVFRADELVDGAEEATARKIVSSQVPIHMAITGDLGIIDGDWRRVGNVPGFSRLDWPMPPFSRIPVGSNEAFLDTMDEDNPDECLGVLSVSPQAALAFPPNVSSGHRALASRVARILGGNVPMSMPWLAAVRPSEGPST